MPVKPATKTTTAAVFCGSIHINTEVIMSVLLLEAIIVVNWASLLTILGLWLAEYVLKS